MTLYYFEWAPDGNGVICRESAKSIVLYEVNLDGKRSKIDEQALGNSGRPRQIAVSPLSAQIALLHESLTGIKDNPRLQEIELASLADNIVGPPKTVMSSTYDMGILELFQPQMRWLSGEELLFPELETKAGLSAGMGLNPIDADYGN